MTLPRTQCHIGPMSMLRTICVYCGSGPGSNPAFVKAAQDFGRILAENKIRLVYGGGSVGLMGELATSVLDHGGTVTGIIPDFLTGREQVLQRAQEVVVTRDMHERKRIMFERSDGFVALPGGIGTLEELVEQLTWAQLGRHKKPILVANIDGFWDPLCALIDHMQNLEFIRPGLTVKLLIAKKVEDILPRMMDALRPVPEPEKSMKVAAVERM
ncbi:MAG: hypothetical protein QOJ96_3363 [Alphaproteobacteria bacterium]|nr:hypothetical protein [Alphaproteobacteria bacterium]